MSRLGIALAVTAITVVGVLLWPATGAACPVCFSGEDANREAYFLTFVLLTTLPLGCIFGVIWWLVRRAARMERAEQEALHRG